MNTEQTERLLQLNGQLTEALTTAAICAEELRTALVTHLDGSKGISGPPGHRDRIPLPDLAHRPVMDQSTKSVRWNGRSCHLGATVQFRLLERLARRPNQYVSIQQLVQDVWDNEDRSTETVRSTVRNLKIQLRAVKMGDLADAIVAQGGYYRLDLRRS